MRTAHVAALACFAASLLATEVASAKCPGENPTEPACEPIVSILMPSVNGATYIPNGDLGAYWGAGVEADVFSWSHNNAAFGPSQGKIRATFDYMASTRAKQLAFYDVGAIASFEGNASRRFLIPYWGVGFGGITETDYGTRLAANASLGLFFVYTRSFVLTGEGSYLLPFTQVENLRGAMARLTASFALW
jgi:hypothetical protein